MCQRNARAGILPPVGTAEKGPARRLIPFDKGPDMPGIICLCLEELSVSHSCTEESRSGGNEAGPFL